MTPRPTKRPHPLIAAACCTLTIGCGDALPATPSDADRTTEVGYGFGFETDISCDPNTEDCCSVIPGGDDDNECDGFYFGRVTEWNPTSNTVLLGTEDLDGRPIALLILPLETAGERVWIERAQLSTTDVRVGTAAELNGKRYAQIDDLDFCDDDDSAELCDGRIGSSVDVQDVNRRTITASFFKVYMQRVDRNAGSPAERIHVTGYFTAID